MNSKDDETNILKSYNDDRGHLPLLNQPATGRTSVTGYRTMELAREAVEYVVNLKSIPDNDPEKLNEGWDGQGTIPSEKLRRGFIEMLMAEYLENVYPEWLGDATDDANACLDTLTYLNGVKEYGWDILMDFVKSNEAPPAFMLPEHVARLLPFNEKED